MMKALHKLRDRFSKKKEPTPSREQLEKVVSEYCIAEKGGWDSASIVILGADITITIAVSTNKRKRIL